MENGANVNDRSRYNDTALMFAAHKGKFGIEDCKVNHNVCIELKLIKQMLILSGHLGIVDLLLKNGANINARNRNLDTALSSAATRGNSVKLHLNSFNENI